LATILLVDDDADIRDLIELYLTRRGHDVTSAGDGLKAIEALRHASFDVLLSDVSMPGMSGLELTTWVRREHQDPGLPVLLVTALNTAADRERGLAAGASDYMFKPFSLAALEARVSALVDTPDPR